MQTKPIFETDLLIIGAGFAGLSAALFAANRNVKTLVCGSAGGFEYASGLMDLWGTSLTREGVFSKKPWDMLSRLPGQMPDHPYAKILPGSLKAGFKEITAALKKQGLVYIGHEARNSMIMTPFGTLKPTFRLPSTMKSNVQAFKKKEPCLILDFRGLREFSAVFFKQALKKTWPHLTTHCLEFPGTQMRTEVFTPFLARSLETEPVQEKLIQRIRPLLKGETCLGLPAMLGVHASDKILNRMEQALKVKIFEIPTSPVSVPGIRLKETLLKALDNTSVTQLSNQRITKVLAASDLGFEFEAGTADTLSEIRAKSVILAGGRFLGRGLCADREKITEPLFGLPVVQPATRDLWHAHSYFDPGGHPINQAGIETDALFRPVNQHSEPVFKSLFVAGSILAHQDWIRTRCGSGLAVGTGFQALQACLQIIGGEAAAL